MTALSGIAPQIVVEDVVATAEYYQDKLGFRLIGYFLDPPVYAMVARDGIQIHFGKSDGAEVQRSNVALRKVGFDFYLWTDNLDEMFEEISARGAQIIQPPVDRVYGNREFSITDCNGMVLTFGQI
ncbi:MAG: VOC family protein [Saprospiraceae bacterium]|nr:VOC family protein [Saprospiraceae bacterium]MCB9319775.1 VOC family protein [Lewinellaceae bacterium]